MEPREDNRWTLTEEAGREANEAHAVVVDEFLTPETMPPNTVGMGVGVKLVGGEPTGEPALMVLVTQKLPREALAEDDLIPGELGGMQTDVLEVGHVRPALTQRFRPARGGCSVANARGALTGTIATGVYDSVVGGAGFIPAYYILSNNHILARSNLGAPGDPIIQPGQADGGSDPADRIATLSRFVPLQFSPAVPLANHRNVVDAAVAEVQRFDDLDREIYWSGPVRAQHALTPFHQLIGLTVKKTGRTT